MNVLHYLPSLDPVEGGVVAHVSDLAILTSGAGVRVRIATSSAEPCPTSLRRAEGVDLVEIGPLNRRTRLLSRSQLESIEVLARDADVVHVHEAWTTANNQIARRLRRAGKPYVVTPHGMLDEWCLAHHAFRKRVYLHVLGSRLLRGAERVLLCAQGELDQSERWFGGTPGCVVPAATDLTPFAVLPGPGAAQEQVDGAAGDDPVVLFLSRVHPKKGVEVLIDAASMLASGGQRFRLIVAGPGEEKYAAQLRERCKQGGIEDRCEFVGMISGSLKVSLYERASVFALPTQQENFGLVLTEAMAARTPVITTKGVDIWPVIEASGGGFIVDRTPEAFARAIKHVLDDLEAGERMGQAGRDWVFAHLGCEVLAARFIEIYREAIEAFAARTRR